MKANLQTLPTDLQRRIVRCLSGPELRDSAMPFEAVALSCTCRSLRHAVRTCVTSLHFAGQSEDNDVSYEKMRRAMQFSCAIQSIAFTTSQQKRKPELTSQLRSVIVPVSCPTASLYQLDISGMLFSEKDDLNNFRELLTHCAHSLKRFTFPHMANPVMLEQVMQVLVEGGLLAMEAFHFPENCVHFGPVYPVGDLGCTYMVFEGILKGSIRLKELDLGTLPVRGKRSEQSFAEALEFLRDSLTSFTAEFSSASAAAVWRCASLPDVASVSVKYLEAHWLNNHDVKAGNILSQPCEELLSLDISVDWKNSSLSHSVNLTDVLASCARSLRKLRIGPMSTVIKSACEAFNKVRLTSLRELSIHGREMKRNSHSSKLLASIHNSLCNEPKAPLETLDILAIDLHYEIETHIALTLLSALKDTLINLKLSVLTTCHFIPQLPSAGLRALKSLSWYSFEGNVAHDVPFMLENICGGATTELTELTLLSAGSHRGLDGADTGNIRRLAPALKKCRIIVGNPMIKLVELHTLYKVLRDFPMLTEVIVSNCSVQGSDIVVLKDCRALNILHLKRVWLVEAQPSVTDNRPRKRPKFRASLDSVSFRGAKQLSQLFDHCRDESYFNDYVINHVRRS